MICTLCKVYNKGLHTYFAWKCFTDRVGREVSSPDCWLRVLAWLTHWWPDRKMQARYFMFSLGIILHTTWTLIQQQCKPDSHARDLNCCCLTQLTRNCFMCVCVCVKEFCYHYTTTNYVLIFHILFVLRIFKYTLTEKTECFLIILLLMSCQNGYL